MLLHALHGTERHAKLYFGTQQHQERRCLLSDKVVEQRLYAPSRQCVREQVDMRQQTRPTVSASSASVIVKSFPSIKCSITCTQRAVSAVHHQRWRVRPDLRVAFVLLQAQAVACTTGIFGNSVAL
jgi:hypothetical protein